MDFLKRAEEYALTQGDENWFKQYYTKYRESYGVHLSVWSTLVWLYGEELANSLDPNHS